MKKLIIAAAVLAAGFAFAQETAPATAETSTESKAELDESEDAPFVWGFGNYGIYSGYQLYGSLLNSEPTLQGYFEVNFNIPADLGYLGVGELPSCVQRVGSQHPLGQDLLVR